MKQEQIKSNNQYIITGIDVNHKRFKIHSNNWLYINMINCYRGSIWEVINGKRKLIKRIYN